jgi:hypothetical protein
MILFLTLLTFCTLLLQVFKCQEDLYKQEQHEKFMYEIEGRIKAEFDKMVEWNRRISLENLIVMAQKNNFTSGKWFLFVPWERADEQWNILKRALVTGKLRVIIFFPLLSLKHIFGSFAIFVH